MRSPACKHSKPKASNCRDCGRSSFWSLISHSGLMQSVTEIKDSLHRAFVGLETVAIARDGICHSLQKAQGVVHVLVAVKGHKAARKQFRDHLAAGQPREHVAVSVFEKENSLQRGALGKGEVGFAVPWGSVHENLGCVSAGRIFPLVFTTNDPVAAHDFYCIQGIPQTRRRALPGTGVTDEQITRAVRAYDTDTMQFNCFLLREAVHDQKLVERIVQWIDGTRKVCKGLLAQLKSCRSEATVHEQPLTRPLAANRDG